MLAREHTPVLLEEVLKMTAPRTGEHVVDCTLGLGGYADAFLRATSPDGQLLGIDRDPSAIAKARIVLQAYATRVHLQHGTFTDIAALAADFPQPAIVVADLGVSSPMLDDPQRGFSFLHDGPLDMRMDTTAGETAADMLNTRPEGELADILWKYGEEPHARAIAQAIAAHRKERLFTRTNELVDVIEAVYRRILHAPPGRRLWLGRGLHPATQTFQALRIAVNDELGQLEKFLPIAFKLLAPGGRLAVVAFHSLEDGIVKRFMRDAAKLCSCPPEQLQCTCGRTPKAKLLTKKPLVPTPAEIETNPRSRSAKLRVLQKAST
jgi:16S rRNA (cytosine1402-N4)-methyltransferase